MAILYDAAMSVMLEFKISEAEIMEMPVDDVWAKYSWLNLQKYKEVKARYGGLTANSSDIKQANKKDEIPERWRSKRFEQTMANGNIKITQRINVMDLWENPGLLSSALSGV